MPETFVTDFGKQFQITLSHLAYRYICTYLLKIDFVSFIMLIMVVKYVICDHPHKNRPSLHLEMIVGISCFNKCN